MFTPATVLQRLSSLFRPIRRGELNEELGFHIEQQTSANLAAGMRPREARRQALLTFGSMEQTREHAHAQRPGFYLEVVAQDLRYALRGLRRDRLFAFAVISTLMLGIGSTTAVFSVIDRILFRPLPYSHANRLVSLGLVQSLETQEFAVGGFYYDWRDRQRPFTAIAAEGAMTHECDLTEARPAQLNCASAEAGLLPLLGVSPVIGRNFLLQEDRPHGADVALITYALWNGRYNRDSGILHRTIAIDGNPFQIIGVLPQSFELPSLHPFDVLFPIALDEAAQRSASLGAPMRIFARLKPGLSVDQARTEMQPLYQSASLLIPESLRSDFHLTVRPLRDRQMYTVRTTAWVLLGTVLTVMLIAVANVASLLLARGAMRTRELAVRSALGASRARLACQAMIEAMLLSLAGAGAGCILAEGLLRFFVRLAPPSIPYLSQTRLDLRIVGLTFLLSLLCGLIFGLASTLQRPTGVMLSARSPQTLSRARLRQALVVSQIAVSMVLLVGAALLLRTFWNLERQQLGMQTDHTITVGLTLGEQNYGTNQKELTFFTQLASRLRYGPGVSVIAIADSVPPAPNHSLMRLSSIGTPTRPPAATNGGGLVTYRWISPAYFQALNIPLVQGRDFTEDDANRTEQLVILSKSLAMKLFPGQNPVGQRLLLDAAMPGSVGGVVRKTTQSISNYTIVGIVADVKNGGLNAQDTPEYYRLRRNRPEDWNRSGAWGSSAVVVLRTSAAPETLIPWIRAQVAALDPTLPPLIETMQQRVSALADQPRFQALLVSFFAATGLLLAIVGLYGVITLLVTERTQEIGTRMALGAQKADVLRLVFASSLRLIALGILMGVALAIPASRALTSLLFEISPHNPATIVGVAALLAAVALLATLLPARAATNVDPMVALRCD